MFIDLVYSVFEGLISLVKSKQEH